MNRVTAWLLGFEEVAAIEQVSISLGAPWSRSAAFWLVLAIAGLLGLSLVFYLLFQRRGSVATRVMLGVMRGLILVLLLLTIARPRLHATLTRHELPSLYVVIDGTESMAQHDHISDEQRRDLAESTGLQVDEASSISRMEVVKSWLTHDFSLLRQLQARGDCQVEVLRFDGTTTSQLTPLDFNGADGHPSRERIDQQLTTSGAVTAIGNMLNQLDQRYRNENLAGVVLISDFAQNSGVAPVAAEATSGESPARRLGVPICTVGIGATEARDLSVAIEVDPKMKRGEQTTLIANLRQSGLQGESTSVRVTARQLAGDIEEQTVGQQTIQLEEPGVSIPFPFVPAESGQYEFVVQARPLDDEVERKNNRSRRQANVVDDFLRLMYVAYEPDWEWRFIKEVFHRDSLVGMNGFRTYLASSDPRVRQTNILFLPTIVPSRSEFFQTDVIFLGDMPQSALSDRFCGMVKEFVGQFGGGLVIVTGPRFGPQQLHGTALRDLLPVVVDPHARLQDQKEFALRLTPNAAAYPFMNLAIDENENAKAWQNLGKLPWFQPVANRHRLTTVLAEHPTAMCADGKTPQPLIAVRRYGKGEVVYVGFNEMWRLRRQFGDKYYRAFWSQLIYRLGMSHALGSNKRFLLRTDRQTYLPEQEVIVTIEAYDENYEPLSDEQLPDGQLVAELATYENGSQGDNLREIPIPMRRPGTFETRFPVFAAGEYRLRVENPVTGRIRRCRFDVERVSAESQSVVRNQELQDDLARVTGGRSYELPAASKLVDQLKLEPTVHRQQRNIPLWTTWMWFFPIVGLMLTEWLVRSFIHLK